MDQRKKTNYVAIRRVLAIGDVLEPEFAEAIELLDKEPGVQLARAAEATESFDLVLVFQSRPGSVPAALVEELHEQTPLAGFAVVLGSWCEGEARTGQPLPRCERVFCYAFPSWWANVCQAWTTDRPTHWQQVAFATQPHQVAPGSLVAINTADTDSADALLTVVDTLGYCGVWFDRRREAPLTTEPVAGIWVGAQLEGLELEQLSAFRNWLPDGVSLTVLLDFPRHQGVQQAARLGTTAVLGKPWRIDQLAAAIKVSDVVSRTSES